HTRSKRDWSTDVCSYYMMQTCEMYNNEERQSNGAPNDRRYVEIIFPTEITGETIPNLIAFNDEIDLPNILFNRIYVTFNIDETSLNVHFVSIDESREYIATVEQQEHYELKIGRAHV